MMKQIFTRYILLQKRMIRKKSYILMMLSVFVFVLALMLVLLVTVGKNAIIENLPMWVAYIVLFIVNFTSLMDSKVTEK